jgi:hypothetical protein
MPADILALIGIEAYIAATGALLWALSVRRDRRLEP